MVSKPPPCVPPGKNTSFTPEQNCALAGAPEAAAPLPLADGVEALHPASATRMLAARTAAPARRTPCLIITTSSLSLTPGSAPPDSDLFRSQDLPSARASD